MFKHLSTPWVLDKIVLQKEIAVLQAVLLHFSSQVMTKSHCLYITRYFHIWLGGISRKKHTISLLGRGDLHLRVSDIVLIVRSNSVNLFKHLVLCLNN